MMNKEHTKCNIKQLSYKTENGHKKTKQTKQSIIYLRKSFRELYPYGSLNNFLILLGLKILESIHMSTKCISPSLHESSESMSQTHWSMYWQRFLRRYTSTMYWINAHIISSIVVKITASLNINDVTSLMNGKLPCFWAGPNRTASDKAMNEALAATSQ